MTNTFWPALFLMFSMGKVWADFPRIAFHYGLNPPIEELLAYDWVVLQPYMEATLVLKTQTRFFAYISLG